MSGVTFQAGELSQGFQCLGAFTAVLCSAYCVWWYWFVTRHEGEGHEYARSSVMRHLFRQEQTATVSKLLDPASFRRVTLHALLLDGRIFGHGFQGSRHRCWRLGLRDSERSRPIGVHRHHGHRHGYYRRLQPQQVSGPWANYKNGTKALRNVFYATCLWNFLLRIE